MSQRTSEFLRVDENKINILNKRITNYDGNLELAQKINPFAVVYIENALKILLNACKTDLSDDYLFELKEKIWSNYRSKKWRAHTAFCAQINEIMFLRSIK